MTNKVKRINTSRLFELQSKGGFHIAWASDMAEVKKLVDSEIHEVVVYKKLGSFVPQETRSLVWKKL